MLLPQRTPIGQSPTHTLFFSSSFVCKPLGALLDLLSVLVGPGNLHFRLEAVTAQPFNHCTEPLTNRTLKNAPHFSAARFAFINIDYIVQVKSYEIPPHVCIYIH